jgi:hypothetical protein
VAPLDGEKIADYLFPSSWTGFMDTIRPYGPMILLLLIFVLPRLGFNVLGLVLTPVLSFFLRLFLGSPL